MQGRANARQCAATVCERRKDGTEWVELGQDAGSELDCSRTGYDFWTKCKLRNLDALILEVWHLKLNQTGL